MEVLATQWQRLLKERDEEDERRRDEDARSASSPKNASAQNRWLASELAETRQAACALEASLQQLTMDQQRFQPPQSNDSLLSIRQSSRSPPGSKTEVGSEKWLYGFFFRLVQVAYGSAEAAWRTAGGDRDGYLSRQSFQLISNLIVLDEAEEAMVWSLLATPSSPGGTYGPETIKYADFVQSDPVALADVQKQRLGSASAPTRNGGRPWK